MKFRILPSATSGPLHEKDFGSVYVASVKGKYDNTVCEVFNVLGSGLWNVILVAEHGAYVSRQILHSDVGTKKRGIELAKEEIEKREQPRKIATVSSENKKVGP
jgi:Ca2+/Na+ antiporter